MSTKFLDDLVNIILDNDKYKANLLLTNVKNTKNSQCYTLVINEMKTSKCFLYIDV